VGLELLTPQCAKEAFRFGADRFAHVDGRARLEVRECSILTVICAGMDEPIAKPFANKIIIVLYCDKTKTSLQIKSQNLSNCSRFNLKVSLLFTKRNKSPFKCTAEYSQISNKNNKKCIKKIPTTTKKRLSNEEEEEVEENNFIQYNYFPIRWRLPEGFSSASARLETSVAVGEKSNVDRKEADGKRAVAGDVGSLCCTCERFGVLEKKFGHISHMLTTGFRLLY
jgi:hypothetical protein